MYQLKKENFDKVFPNAKNADDIVKAINEYAPRFGIDSKEAMAMFLAQAGHESGNFTTFEENLNYSSSGLANTWPNRYAEKKNGVYVKDANGRYVPNALGTKLNRDKVGIANHTYANRMGNGSPESGDGWLRRGRGIFQLTGTDNYAALAKDEPALASCMTNPDILLQPYEAVISALWFWNKNNLGRHVATKDIKSNTKAINGGLNGIIHRTELYTALLKM